MKVVQVFSDILNKFNAAKLVSLVCPLSPLICGKLDMIHEDVIFHRYCLG